MRAEHAPYTGRTWLDLGGYFLFGKYQNSLAEDVAEDDPYYVEDICEEDREILAQLLNYRNQRRS